MLHLSLFLLLFCCCNAHGSTQSLTFALPFEDVSSIKIYGKRFSSFYESVFSPINRDVKFVYYPSKRSLQIADSGVIDGEAARLAGLLEYGMVQNLIRIEPPITEVQTRVFGETNHPPIKDWQALAKMGGRVGLQRGMVIWAARARKHGVKLVELNRIGQGLDLLVAKRIDYLIAAGGITEKVIHAKNQGDKVEALGTLDLDNIHLWLHKKHQDLIPQVEKQIRRLKLIQKNIPLSD
ncbi:substrate-binding periplasmic protein [Pseudobacteriovorax antillogorgiicola]|uniref:Extracellular solute-binding protein, family 3 n=1 Tax=Pseudobacteriovorax antillogorgiicola TaxID=1513793 RepID=A0A1Y6BGK5_9BACT|nr:transporter substrate-binding domain-containing protein [Pseudobacteriovorax antillogorgiicola]TCS57319.1 extracellular solute-binding protein (family 3) [Pseudobacteriovorax antillogorgiicola]SMF02579.1 extracellular solute-binding protein, family 3 [Pseudobacteriovorax antillogorgiicola]